MKTYLTKAELKLMEVIWEKGQIPSNKLVKECLERFNWKKSTTYTNLKKLVDKKMVCNSEAVIADEPTGNLDPENQEQIMKMVREKKL